MKTRLTQFELEEVAVSLISDLTGVSVRLVTDGPVTDPLAVVSDFTEADWTGYARDTVTFDGPYLDVPGNPYLQAPQSTFLNTGTTNVTTTGAIGVTGTVTTPTLAFVYQFSTPALIPVSGTLNVPHKVALPLTVYEIPDPFI